MPKIYAPLDPIFKRLKEFAPETIEIKVSDGIIVANKCLLAIRSPMFKTMFASEMIETESGVVDMSMWSMDSMERIVKYCETTMFEFSENSVELFQLADYLQIPNFVAGFEDAVTTQTCLFLLDMAVASQCESLIKATNKCLKNNPYACLEENPWLYMSADTMKLILQCEGLVYREDHLLNFFLNWLDQNNSDENKELFQYIHIGALPFAAIEKLQTVVPASIMSPQLFKLVNDTKANTANPTTARPCSHCLRVWTSQKELLNETMDVPLEEISTKEIKIKEPMHIHYESCVASPIKSMDITVIDNNPIKAPPTATRHSDLKRKHPSVNIHSSTTTESKKTHPSTEIKPIVKTLHFAIPATSQFNFLLIRHSGGHKTKNNKGNWEISVGKKLMVHHMKFDTLQIKFNSHV
eukprot:TRINITY_DN6344_c0_g2_i1.p1 TRINITY_DN6344_c0_g2~~TRINITY_DN6344_c0_g2_i1.p1  ORF type:complete len:410 (+),score=98.46 TRINITY_DN6344_c0_g2_i1:94-1323(+)